MTQGSTFPQPAAWTLEGPVVVTGASGFVGGAIARLLHARGARVRSVVRAGTPTDAMSDVPIEWIRGDLRDPTVAAKALAGSAALFHAAADYRLWAPRPQEIFENNVALTHSVVDAAARESVRSVFTSSVATLKGRRDGSGGTEDDPSDVETAIGPYKKGKIEAERIVRSAVEQGRLQAVIVNPSTPVGPGDVKPTPTGRIVVEAASGHMPAYVASGLNVAHVADIAEGHLLAFEKGRVGERYILGGDDVPLGTFLREVCRRAGRSGPYLRLPNAVAGGFAVMAEAGARITGREPFATRDGVRMARQSMYFSSAKAERELGYAHRPYAEAVADAIAWFRLRGLL